MVEEIVESFRSGRQDVAEFWIQLKGRFVHIRYFAVRDSEGGYLGTLEVTQDLTRLRGLEGERRLLAVRRLTWKVGWMTGFEPAASRATTWRRAEPAESV